MYHHAKRIAAATILLGVVGMLVQPAQGSGEVRARGSSALDMFGGRVSSSFHAHDSSVVNMSGGRL